MADLEHITIDGTKYDISDAEARAKVEQISGDMSDKADKSALTDGSVTKVGTATVGSGTNPMYLDNGTPKASTATVGSSAKPVYMKGGTVTECDASFEDLMADIEQNTKDIEQNAADIEQNATDITANKEDADKKYTELNSALAKCYTTIDIMAIAIPSTTIAANTRTNITVDFSSLASQYDKLIPVYATTGNGFWQATLGTRNNTSYTLEVCVHSITSTEGTISGNVWFLCFSR